MSVFRRRPEQTMASSTFRERGRELRNVSIPPPIAMTWQLTVPSSEDIDSSPFQESPSTEIEVECEPKWVQRIHALEHKFDGHPLSIHPDNGNIIRTLNQYDHYTSYRTYSTIVITGFVRRSQCEICPIIPPEIANICLSFYFEEESDCIYVAFTLYKQLKINDFSGQVLTSLLKNNEFHLKHAKDVTDICTDLIKYKFIEMVSYRTNFSSLFNKSKEPLFDTSSHCTYQFTPDVSLAFKKYSEMELNARGANP
eukprot:234899_1